MAAVMDIKVGTINGALSDGTPFVKTSLRRYHTLIDKRHSAYSDYNLNHVAKYLGINSDRLNYWIANNTIILFPESGEGYIHDINRLEKIKTICNIDSRQN